MAFFLWKAENWICYPTEDTTCDCRQTHKHTQFSHSFMFHVHHCFITSILYRLIQGLDQKQSTQTKIHYKSVVLLCLTDQPTDQINIISSHNFTLVFNLKMMLSKLFSLSSSVIKSCLSPFHIVFSVLSLVFTSIVCLSSLSLSLLCCDV